MFERLKAWRCAALRAKGKIVQACKLYGSVRQSQLIPMEADDYQALRLLVSNGPMRMLDASPDQQCRFRNLAARGLLRAGRRGGEKAWALSPAGWTRLRDRPGGGVGRLCHSSN